MVVQSRAIRRVDRLETEKPESVIVPPSRWIPASPPSLVVAVSISYWSSGVVALEGTAGSKEMLQTLEMVVSAAVTCAC